MRSRAKNCDELDEETTVEFESPETTASPFSEALSSSAAVDTSIILKAVVVEAVGASPGAVVRSAVGGATEGCSACWDSVELDVAAEATEAAGSSADCAVDCNTAAAVAEVDGTSVVETVLSVAGSVACGKVAPPLVGAEVELLDDDHHHQDDDVD